MRSSTTASKPASRAFLAPMAPSVASSTSNPASRRPRTIPPATPASSSTTSTREEEGISRLQSTPQLLRNHGERRLEGLRCALHRFSMAGARLLPATGQFVGGEHEKSSQGRFDFGPSRGTFVSLGCGSSAEAETLARRRPRWAKTWGPGASLGTSTIRPRSPRCRSVRISRPRWTSSLRMPRLGTQRSRPLARRWRMPSRIRVQAGRVDRAALKPQLDALLAAIDKVRPSHRAAFVRLHDILDAKQRGQFVDALEAGVQAWDGAPRRAPRPKQVGGRFNFSDAQREQLKSAIHAKLGGEAGSDAKGACTRRASTASRCWSRFGTSSRPIPIAPSSVATRWRTAPPRSWTSPKLRSPS